MKSDWIISSSVGLSAGFTSSMLLIRSLAYDGTDIPW